MKTCSGCKECLPFEAFAKKGLRKDGTQIYQSFCRDCNKRYNKQHYITNKTTYLDQQKQRRAKYRQVNLAFLLEYTNQGCAECPEKDFVCLEFDHDDRESKRFMISEMIDSYTLPRLKEELAKCTVRCANCHRRRTAKQFNWYQDLHALV